MRPLDYVVGDRPGVIGLLERRVVHGRRATRPIANLTMRREFLQAERDDVLDNLVAVIQSSSRGSPLLDRNYNRRATLLERCHPPEPLK
jgi:hypothetical protein